MYYNTNIGHQLGVNKQCYQQRTLQDGKSKCHSPFSLNIQTYVQAFYHFYSKKSLGFLPIFQQIRVESSGQWHWTLMREMTAKLHKEQLIRNSVQVATLTKAANSLCEENSHCFNNTLQYCCNSRHNVTC